MAHLIQVRLLHLVPRTLLRKLSLGFGALAAAVGIFRVNRWGWTIGFLVAGGAFAGYLISRTVGLPGLPVETEWLEPLRVLSLPVESLFVGVCLVILARPKEETRVVEASPSASSSG